MTTAHPNVSTKRFIFMVLFWVVGYVAAAFILNVQAPTSYIVAILFGIVGVNFLPGKLTQIGIFDVEVDGRVIFSKFVAGRFPHPNEVTKLLSS